MLVLSLCAMLLASVVNPAAAQTTIQMTENSASLSFPTQITFYLAAQSPAVIDSITLVYGTNGRSCLTESAREAIEFEPAEKPRLSWTWDLRRSGSLPPGAEVWWQWQLHTTSGDTLTTSKQTLVVEDNYYHWQHLAQGNLSVYWAEGDARFGSMMMRLAASSLERLSIEAGVRPSGSVRLTIYPSVEEVRSAALNLPDWTGGVAFPEYGSIMTGIAPGEEDWAADVIPHELAHLVTDERIFNCTGARLPTWLSEGLAVFAEGQATEQDMKKLDEALAGDRIPSLHTLADGFSSNSDRASLSYIQSGDVVRYLIDTYGADQLNDLLAEVQAGRSTDAALKAVYQMDTDQVDAVWRASHGYATAPPAASPTSQPAEPQRTAIPTLPLWSPQVSTTPTAAPSATPVPTHTTEPTQTPAMPTGTPTSQAASAQKPPRGFTLTIPAAGLPAAGLIVAGALAWFTLRKRSKKP